MFNTVTTLMLIVMFGMFGALIASAMGKNKYIWFFVGCSGFGLLALIFFWVVDGFKKARLKGR